MERSALVNYHWQHLCEAEHFLLLRPRSVRSSPLPMQRPIFSNSVKITVTTTTARECTVKGHYTLYGLKNTRKASGTNPRWRDVLLIIGNPAKVRISNSTLSKGKAKTSDKQHSRSLGPAVSLAGYAIRNPNYGRP